MGALATEFTDAFVVVVAAYKTIVSSESKKLKSNSCLNDFSFVDGAHMSIEATAHISTWIHNNLSLNSKTADSIRCKEFGCWNLYKWFWRIRPHVSNLFSSFIQHTHICIHTIRGKISIIKLHLNEISGENKSTTANAAFTNQHECVVIQS